MRSSPAGNELINIVIVFNVADDGGREPASGSVLCHVVEQVCLSHETCLEILHARR